MASPQLLDGYRDENWCVVMRPNSPGDIIRLMHGIYTKFGGKTPTNLICNTEFKEKWYTGVWSPFLNVRLHELEGLELCETGPDGCSRPKSEYTASEIVTAWKNAYSGKEFPGRYNPNSNKPTISYRTIWTSYSHHRTKAAAAVTATEVVFRKIDAKCNNPNFVRQKFFNYVTPQTPRPNDCIKIAVVLRDDKVDEWRNSPSYHYNHTFWSQFGVSVDYFGYAKEEKYLNHPHFVSSIPALRCHGYDKLSLKEQIERAQSYHLAIGVNSSALDVFAAAGCMVIREAVFQGYAKWCFGWEFNYFFGDAPNIELRIKKAAYQHREKRRRSKRNAPNHDYQEQTPLNQRWADEERLKSTILIALEHLKQTQGRLLKSLRPLVEGFEDELPSEMERLCKWLDNPLNQSFD